MTCKCLNRQAGGSVFRTDGACMTTGAAGSIPVHYRALWGLRETDEVC